MYVHAEVILVIMEATSNLRHDLAIKARCTQVSAWPLASPDTHLLVLPHQLYLNTGRANTQTPQVREIRDHMVSGTPC